MKKMIEITAQLVNIERHEEVWLDNNFKKYIPVSVVRGLAHQLIVEIRKQEASDQEVLGYIEKAEQILRGLNVIGAEDDS